MTKYERLYTADEVDGMIARAKAAAAQPEQEQESVGNVEALRHSANEWADMAANGLQWVRNIAEGISTAQEALSDLEANLAHCREVNDRREVQVFVTITPPAKPAPVQPEREPVAKHHDLHSHMMVVAHRAVDEASNNGRESISQKEVVRAICKAIQSNKNLLAKLTPPAAQQIDEAHSAGYSNGMTEGYEAGKAYAAAQHQWVGLTDEEIDKTHETQVWDARRSFARAIEAKLKEKNT